MTRLKLFNTVSFGALALSGLLFVSDLLSNKSYWLLRGFYACVIHVSTTLIWGSLIFGIAIVLWYLVRILNWKTTARRPDWRKTALRLLLWLVVFLLSGLNFLSAIFLDSRTVSQATFDRQDYYLVGFSDFDHYKYWLYRCNFSGLICSRSSEPINIPYQQQSSIELRYNAKTREIYIQGGDRVILIPRF